MKTKLLCLLIALMPISRISAQVLATVAGSIPDSIYQDIQWQKKQIAEKMQKSVISYFVVNAPGGKFGYFILIDGNLYLEQLSVPALGGNDGFTKREDAENTARLVIEKIKQGEMPPTISVENLKTLNVITDQ